METSLVGVMVFDATTGRSMTFNQEARRIVENLCLPGDPPPTAFGVTLDADAEVGVKRRSKGAVRRNRR